MLLWIEESFGASEHLGSNFDNVTIWEFIFFSFSGVVFEGFHFFVKVKSYIAEFFLDVPDNFSFGRGSESVSLFSEESHHVIGKVSTGKIISLDSMWERVTLIDWDSMSNTITRIHNATSNSTRGVEGKNSLNSNIESWDVEILKENLDHSLSVLLGVSWSFSEESTLVFSLNG